LSNVIAYSKKGDVWLTIQVHSNIVAVAVLKELAAIIIVQGREPADDTIQKAKEESIPILISKLSTFELVGKLYELGIGKEK
jgi:predicted transcriptional regulator